MVFPFISELIKGKSYSNFIIIFCKNCLKGKKQKVQNYFVNPYKTWL